MDQDVEILNLYRRITVLEIALNTVVAWKSPDGFGSNQERDHFRIVAQKGLNESERIKMGVV